MPCASSHRSCIDAIRSRLGLSFLLDISYLVDEVLTHLFDNMVIFQLVHNFQFLFTKVSFIFCNVDMWSNIVARFRSLDLPSPLGCVFVLRCSVDPHLI